MKKDNIIVIKTVLLVVISLMVLFILFNKKMGYEFKVNKSSNKDKVLYFTYEDRDVYLAGIDKISMNITNKNYELKKAILDKKISFEKVFEKAKKSNGLWDGGTFIYEYDDFAIISCNHIQEDGKENCKDIVVTDIKNKDNIDLYCSN